MKRNFAAKSLNNPQPWQLKPVAMTTPANLLALTGIYNIYILKQPLQLPTDKTQMSNHSKDI